MALVELPQSADVVCVSPAPGSVNATGMLADALPPEIPKGLMETFCMHKD
ncbi:MAG TPA: hypothetical protein VFT45_11200 [Longimicrobium sp.]|nr:hypothetical protein [Longimicrobium sp.]